MKEKVTKRGSDSDRQIVNLYFVLATSERGLIQESNNRANQSGKMTAESLKTFITLPTTTIYKNGGGAERGAHQKAKLFCFALFLAAFCVTVSCYQVRRVGM